jgi:hypothetical protein
MLVTGESAMRGRAGPFRRFLKQPTRFDILSRRVPALAGAGAKEERDAREEVERLLSGLNAFVGDFRAGLELLGLADTHTAFARSWGPIACRDAAVALRRFRDTLRQIDDALKDCPPLNIARKAVRAAEKRFAGRFPMARGRSNGATRNGNGKQPHPHGDMADATIVADVSRSGRRVAYSSDGRAIRFDLAEEALWQLVALRDEAFAAFAEAPDRPRA